MAAWFASGARATGAGWQDHVLGSPVWRFALGSGVISAEGWIGLMAGSIDGAGRLFPFAAMVSADVGKGEGADLDTLDILLDAVELPFLEFMEARSPQTHDGLTSALDAFAGRLAGTAFDIGGVARTLPTVDEAAVVMVTDGVSGTDLLSTPLERADSPDLPPSTAWWHPETPTAFAARCVSRGMLRAPYATALFDGEWGRHGWAPR
jgi:type VI secretion system ImpM family protein